MADQPAVLIEPNLTPGGAHVRFSPTIELGHLLQALVILASVGGWAVVGYYTITRQIDIQSTMIQQQATRYDGEMMLVKQRVTVAENAIVEMRDAMHGAAGETKQTLTKIIDQIADLRTLVASQGHDAAPRAR